MARTSRHFVVRLALTAALSALSVALDGSWDMHLLGRAQAQGFPTDPITGAPQGISSNGMNLPGGGGGASPQYFPLNNLNYGGPSTPDSPSRPSSWPGGAADPGARRPRTQRYGTPHFPSPSTSPRYPVIQAAAALPASPAKKSPADPPYDPAEIIAYVGTEIIQANEILPSVHQQLEAFFKRAGPAFQQLPEIERKEQINAGMKMLMKQFTDELIKTKLLVSEIHRKLPPESINKTEKQVRDQFNTNELPLMRARYKATSNSDLDTKLRALGSSLDAQRTVFIERYFAFGWLNQQVKEEQKEVTHEQMLEYYKTHISEWESPARARWEQLTVLYKNYDSKVAARGALVQWGNEIFYGKPFAEVAKAHSQDPAAEDGGVHDWVSKGGLRSEPIDQALFSPALPVGALSQIVEDDDGMHIIRLLERDDAKTAPFTEVQAQIKAALQDTDKDRQRNEYIEKLREQTRVLTIFDPDFEERIADPNVAAPADTPPAALPASSAPTAVPPQAPPEAPPFSPQYSAPAAQPSAP